MSVSQISAPEDHQPAYNPIEFVFSSTNSAVCDFVFIGDLYINGNFVIRLKEFPKATTGYGHFRIERVLQDFLSHDFDPEVTDFEANPNSICDYHLEIRERYNPLADCTGQPSLSAVLHTTSKRYAWNGALQYHEQPSYAAGDFDLKTSASRFLTSVPNGIKLENDDYFTMKMIQALSVGSPGGFGTSYELVIKTYDFNDNLINTFTHSNPHYNTTDTEKILLTVPVGPKNIASIATINSNVNYYTIGILDNSSGALSETKKFYVKDRCTKFKKYRFWFLNRLGGFDAVSFDLRSFRKLDIVKGTFNKLLDVDYEIGDRGETVTSVDAKTSYTVSSDWLTEDEALWLEELFTSPEAYVYETKNKVERVKIEAVVCDCPISLFDITGAAHNVAGTANLFIDDTAVGAGGIITGTFFSYSGTGFSSIGSPNSGTHKQITGYDIGGGFYTTNIVSTINAGALITGTLTLEVDPCVTTFTLEGGITLPIGTEFSYRVNNGSPIGMANVGYGTVTGHGASPGEHETDVPCNISVGALITGSFKYETTTITMIPIIVSNPTYEEKIKANVKNIQYTVEFRPSFKKNIQGS